MSFMDDVEDLEGRLGSARASSLLLGKLQTFPDYVAQVYAYEVGCADARARLRGSDGEAYRERVSELDRNRHRAHVAACDACSIINRMCDKTGVAHICPDVSPTGSDYDDATRAVVARFAERVTCEIFDQRDTRK